MKESLRNAESEVLNGQPGAVGERLPRNVRNQSVLLLLSRSRDVELFDYICSHLSPIHFAYYNRPIAKEGNNSHTRLTRCVV